MLHTRTLLGLAVLIASCTAMVISRSYATHFIHLQTMDGSYNFSYDTGPGIHQSFREETRLPDGRVNGRFGYVDPTGVLRVTIYTAGSHGYRSSQTVHYLVRNQYPIIGPVPY